MAHTMVMEKVKIAKPFDEALCLAGFGKFNIYVLLATGLCLMCVIIESMCAMFITPAAQCDLNLDLSQKGLMYSISFLGIVSSSHMWGYLADTKGRKIVLIVSLVSSAVVGFICSFVSLPWLFILLRFINGFLIGGSSAIIYAFAGEFHDDIFRPKVVSWIATFVALGNMYLPGLAWVVLPQNWSFEIPYINLLFRPWRLLAIIYSMPSLLAAFLIFFLPESPKYLLTQGKHKEVMVILTKIFCVNTGKKPGDYAVSSIIWSEAVTGVQHEENENMFKSMWRQTVPLFKREFLVKTLLVCFLQFSIFLTTSSIIMWYPQILNSMTEYGKNESESKVTMCKSILFDEETTVAAETSGKSLISKTCRDTVNTEVFLVSLVVGIAYACCYVFIGSVINILGKKNLLVGFLVVTTVSGLCAQLLSGYSLIQIGLGIFLMAGTGIGIVNAISVDLYPTQIRGMALAVSLMFGRFGAMTGSNIGGPLMSQICDYTFYIIATIHILIIIVVVLLPSAQKSRTEVETKEER
ncbi:synaptic vesicle glycoprotein 2B [Anoplophora glabripennis]|uniref:synaptic vesicle glycoprotein 2B n=1 Tax=Anoplophora glabripennis TaxID=217634 RepID=UPI0008747B3E|nr:synaptic vesicle glycoprotein 2B [Anoplophora glabripennis]